MYDLFREKNICYVKIMLGRGLTDYGKSMALRSMEYWYQWISGNKSFIFRILFSAQFQIAHIYILIIFGHQTLMYICYRANLDGFFLDGRILLNRFCFDIRAFPSFIELRIYRKIAKNWTQSEFYGGKIADFYIFLKEIERNPRMAYEKKSGKLFLLKIFKKKHQIIEWYLNRAILSKIVFHNQNLKNNPKQKNITDDRYDFSSRWDF